MKRALAAVLAALMVLCMATTVFAADSSASGSKVTEPDQKIEEIDYTKVQKPDEVVANFADGKTVTLVDAFDLTSENLKVEIFNPAFKDGDQILVLHWNGTEWEKVGVFTATAGKLNVDFTSTGLSPVAFYKVGANSTSTAPKTGEVNVLPMMMMICAAGVLVCMKKSRA